MCAKKAKKIQTDYTRGGRDISNTAVPLYQNTLNQMAEYNNDPSAKIDYYRDKYYTNNVAQDDFQRNYMRNMANASSNNYAATHGGYSSAGQRAYEDIQRGENDAFARLYDQGIANSAAMAQQEFNNLLNSTDKYHNAYTLGKDYSDIEQYNHMADVANSWNNQLGAQMGTIGGAIGSMWGPAGQMLGKGIGDTIGNAMSTDTSDFFGSQGTGAAQAQGSGASGSDFTNLLGGINGGKGWGLGKGKALKLGK